MKTKKKEKQHYVNNADFLAAIIKYKEKVKNAEEQGLPKPRVNNYIGGCFLKEKSMIYHMKIIYW